MSTDPFTTDDWREIVTATYMRMNRSDQAMFMRRYFVNGSQRKLTSLPRYLAEGSVSVPEVAAALRHFAAERRESVTRQHVWREAADDTGRWSTPIAVGSTARGRAKPTTKAPTKAPEGRRVRHLAVVN